MPHVVTQSCCADASCVLACPVNCIHPAPGEPGFGTSEMVFIDPNGCVDCGACITACPVGAISPGDRLAADQEPFRELNAAYFADFPHADRTPLALVAEADTTPLDLRVAVVGAGPAGLYAADELLTVPGVRVDVYDRLPVPHGLVRAGVAPDHVDTKKIQDLFHKIENEDGFEYRLGVEVGRDIGHDELASAYDAVVYAVGAATDRPLGIDGEDLVGSISATDLVAWYNGHPDRAALEVDLSHERVVIIGNGNVALDVARVLALPPGHLAATDISDKALATLRHSAVREVVILGRRGPADAAFTLPELMGLAAESDIEVVVEGDVGDSSAKESALAELGRRSSRPGVRRIVFRFHTSPTQVGGDERVTGLEVETPHGPAMIEAGLVVRAIGYRATPVAGLPFDDVRAVVPNEHGRVTPGTYVTGWIKRGPTGFIGTNKTDSKETVAALLEDARAGRLARPTADAPDLGAITRDGWARIDRHERRAGFAAGRPRVKLLDAASLQAAAAAPSRRRRRSIG